MQCIIKYWTRASSRLQGQAETIFVLQPFKLTIGVMHMLKLKPGYFLVFQFSVVRMDLCLAARSVKSDDHNSERLNWNFIMRQMEKENNRAQIERMNLKAIYQTKLWSVKPAEIKHNDCEEWQRWAQLYVKRTGLKPAWWKLKHQTW